MTAKESARSPQAAKRPAQASTQRFAPPQGIEVRESPGKGLGVFATVAIKTGETVEESPVLSFPTSDLYSPAGTAAIAGFVFLLSDHTVGLTLGFGSIYNHSYTPNAAYEDLPVHSKRFYAIRDILAGEEITINYNGSPEDDSPVGFEVC